MEEHRSEPRYLVSEDAFLWDLHHMNSGYVPAKITDVSRNGMRLTLPRPFPQGSELAIDFRGMIICGSVRHCETAGHQYALGIRVREILDPLMEHPVELVA